MRKADLYFSFRSPYSYLAVQRLARLVERFELAFDVRPVLPLAVRKPEFFEHVNPLWLPYLFRDTTRVAEYYDIDYRLPPMPDPIDQDMTTLAVAREQPRIRRLTRLAACAAEQGDALPLVREVSAIIWNGKIDGWDQGEHLSQALARAGHDLGELERTAEREAARYDAAIEANQTALESAGHWGVPTMVFEGEPFWGQDRIDLLLWRMKQRGLRER